MGPGEARLAAMDRARPRHRADDARAVGLVAVGADADALAIDEVEARDRLQEAMDEVLARLLALGDDVDAGVFLLHQNEARCVALGLVERVPGFGPPRRPQRLRLGEPGRLGQAARHGRLNHARPL